MICHLFDNFRGSSPSQLSQKKARILSNQEHEKGRVKCPASAEMIIVGFLPLFYACTCGCGVTITAA